MSVPKAMSLEGAIRDIAAAVDRRLDLLLPADQGLEGRVAAAMRYAVQAGGKRLRPFLVVTSADLFGVSRDCALRVAAAVECVHTYSLIHDDLPCMDNADMRRGRPSTHKKFDEATAVLAGDALLTIAFEFLSDEKSHADPRVRLELVRGLATAAGYHGMVGGQMMDIAAQHAELDMAAVTRLQNLKTGALISFCAEAGAILGKAPLEKRHALRGFAHDFGLAYQIVDDLLDTAGDAAALGKATGQDAAMGKATLVAVLGGERARRQAELLTEQAIEHLSTFGPQADILRELARFAINRQS